MGIPAKDLLNNEMRVYEKLQFSLLMDISQVEPHITLLVQKLQFHTDSVQAAYSECLWWWESSAKEKESWRWPE